MTLKTLFEEIEKNSPYHFNFFDIALPSAANITINADNEAIEPLLNRILTPVNLEYTRAGNTFAIKQKAEFPSRNITGVISDYKGEPMIGANVVVKGTTIGTVTDMNGQFSLTTDNKATLVISYIGYLAQEISVGKRTSFNIKLQEDNQSINEVIVVGYGTQKKVNLTGSISNIDYEKIASRPSSNTINALAGSIPGLTIVQGSGQPGNDIASINIRGLGSINAAVEPLIIIDGVSSTVNDFAVLNPYDIKEISVLKDAASAAIYGSRAANGVILVTTAIGQYEKTKVSVNAYWGLQQATVLPDMLNAWDFAMLENESRTNSGLAPFFTQEQIELMKNNDPSDGFGNTNWTDEIFRTSPVQNYNVSINAGTEKLRVYAGFNYYNQDGILINTNSDRYNLRNKFDLTVNKYIKLGLNTSAMLQNSHQPQPSLGGSDFSILGTVYGTPPAAPVYYNNGNYFVIFNDVPGYQRMYNPVMQANYGYNKGTRKNFMSAFTAEITLDKFKYNSIISYNYRDGLTKAWSPLEAFTNDADVVVWDTNFANLSERFSKTDVIQIENYLNYNQTFAGIHSFSALIGHSFISNKYMFIEGYGRNFPSNALQVLSSSSSDSQRAYGEKTENNIQSVFGRANYILKDRYLFEGNIRYDGSSKFALGNKYGVFPSFALGWRISEESFVKTQKWLDNLKLRLSWGILGNQEIGGNYPYAAVYSATTSYLIDGSYVNGASITKMANDKISWETTHTTNVGLDINLLGKFEFVFDYFVKNTKDMLVMLPIPLTLGDLGAPYQNIGKIQNKGWELSGIYRDKINDLNYSLNFNISQIKNKAIDLNEQEWYPSNQIIREGIPLFSWYGYKTEGIFQSQEEIDASPAQSPAALPGDLKKKNIGGDPDKIDTYDRTVIGKSFPEITYSFGGSLNYKDFDLSLFFQGVAEVDVNTFSRVNHTGNGGNPKNWGAEWIDRWTPEKPSNKYPRLDYNRSTNQEFSDYWLEDGSYIRLKNIELGYQIPKNILKRIHVEKLRFFLGAQNLFTFTKLKHFDPERSSGQVRSEFYPQLRIYQIGLNLSF